jgi:hypothetical protein
MVQRIGIILICLSLTCSASAEISYSGKTVSAVKKYDSSWEIITPKKYESSTWLALISPEYRLVVGMGQSNLVGMPSDNVSDPVVTVAGIEIHTDGSYTVPLIEPTGNNDSPFHESGHGGYNQGSLWLAFANKYYDLSGQKIIVLSLGINGTLISQWTGGYMADAVGEITTAINQLQEDGYYFEFENVIWLQGESDNNNGTTTIQYKTALNSLWTYIKQQFPSYSLELSISYPYKVGEYACQPAQLAYANEEADVYLDYPVDTPFCGNLVHFCQAQYNEIGETIAVNIYERQ